MTRRPRPLLRSLVGYAFGVPALCWAVVAFETGHWIPAAIAGALAVMGWLAVRALGGGS